MAVEIEQTPHETLARAAKKIAAGLGLRDSLELIAAAARDATAADVAAVRALDPGGGSLVVRAAAPVDSPLAAELVGSGIRLDELEDRLANDDGLLFPAYVGEQLAGALELFGADAERAGLAELAAAQLGLVLRQER